MPLGLIVLGLVVGGLCYAVYATMRYGTPLNDPPRDDDLDKLQRLFADPEKLTYRAFRSRLFGGTESYYIGTLQYLRAAQSHFRNFMQRRTVAAPDHGSEQKFDSDRGLSLLRYYSAAGLAVFTFLFFYYQTPYSLFFFLLATGGVIRGFFVSRGKVTDVAIIFGRSPCRKIIPYSAVTDLHVDLTASQGFVLSITSGNKKFGIYESKLAKLLSLYDTIIQKRPDLRTEPEKTAI